MQRHPVQAPARVGLEIVHDSLRLSLAFNYDVNMVGAHLGSQQTPATL